MKALPRRTRMVTPTLAAALVVGTPVLVPPAARAADRPVVQANRVGELTFTSRKHRPDPFNEVELDVLFTGPDRDRLRVPAFWAGGRRWRVRFASPRVGTYRYRSECSDPADAGLHGVEGHVEV